MRAAELGEELYYACATCHQEDGSGSQPLDAPRIAEMAAWYVADQLRNFKRGVRGDHPDDIYGRQMALFAKALPDEASIEAVAKTVSGLTGQQRKGRITGDLDQGRSLYAACAACHGQAGEGREELRAPALTGLDDWYLVRQLNNYREGRRGYAADDIPGQQMRAAAKVLTDDTDVTDVVLYIGTLAAPR
jgi:cytochrome c oxidase subunit 2